MRRRPNKGRTQTRPQAIPKPMPVGDYRLVDTKVGGMPDSFVSTLEYSDIVKVSSSIYRAVYTFTGNSLYDPDSTSTGHQPLYFDQNMQVYTKYKVLSAKVTVRFIGSSTAYCYMVPLTSILTASADAPQFSELPRSQVVAVGNAGVIPSVPITAKYTTQAILGLSPAQLASESYSGTDASSPSQLWYINLIAIDPDTTVAVTVYAHVHISYTALFYDRRATAVSLPAPAPKELPSVLKSK